MKYNKLGNTDIEVSVICLGTMTYGEQNTEADAHKQLDYAIEQGVNFIDTAELYAVPAKAENNGLTEKYIGTWLKDRKDRDKIILATKITGPSPNLKFIRDPLNFSRQQIETAIDGSLKRLQTDYVDLYQLHWPERNTNFFGKRGYFHLDANKWQDNLLEVLEVFNDLVKQGKIRHFGISNETAWGLMRFVKLAEEHKMPRCMSVQNPYNLLNRIYEIGLAEPSIREQAGLLAYSPMAFGMLSGKYHRGSKPEKGRLTLYPSYSRYSSENSKKATQGYLDIADKYELSLAQMSLAFINRQPFLTSNIIGATTMDQLKENISSIEIDLSEEILKEIEEIHNQIVSSAPLL